MQLIFTHPGYLFLLFLIPLMFLLHFLSIKFRRSYALRFANFDSIAKIKGIDLYSKNIVVLGISCVIIFLMVFSLAGATLKTQGNVSSFSFVIALDSSNSMQATDFQPSRMEAAKQTAKDFVDSSPPGTRVAVLSFAGNGVIEQTITDDKQLLDNAIDGINITSVGGTNIFNAVATAATLLVAEKTKAVILLSDGQTNVGTIQQAIDYAVQNDLVINTIGMGTPEGSYTAYGLTRLDEQSLQSMAFNTGGQYYLVQNKTSLENSFSRILQLKQGTLVYDLSPIFLILAAVLFIIDYFLSGTRFGIFP